MHMKKGDIKSLFSKFNKIPNVLDGACGSLLQEKFKKLLDEDIWMTKVNTYHPEEVKRLSLMYLENGANLLTTNTFRTNPSCIKKYNSKNSFYPLDYDDEVRKAISILDSLRSDTGKDFIIMGSNSPAEDCYKKTQDLSYNELKDNHIQHIKSLVKHGADLILNETLSFWNEIQICGEFCKENNIDFIVSLYVNENLMLNSGEYVKDILKNIDDMNPIAISVNCISLETFESFIINSEEVIKSLNCGFGYYLNCGDSKKIESCGGDDFGAYVTPENYRYFVEKYSYLNPVFIGTCCMSSPLHTKEIYEYINKKN